MAVEAVVHGFCALRAGLGGLERHPERACSHEYFTVDARRFYVRSCRLYYAQFVDANAGAISGWRDSMQTTDARDIVKISDPATKDNGKVRLGAMSPTF